MKNHEWVMTGFNGDLKDERARWWHCLNCDHRVWTTQPPVPGVWLVPTDCDIEIVRQVMES